MLRRLKLSQQSGLMTATPIMAIIMPRLCTNYMPNNLAHSSKSHTRARTSHSQSHRTTHPLCPHLCVSIAEVYRANTHTNTHISRIIIICITNMWSYQYCDIDLKRCFDMLRWCGLRMGCGGGRICAGSNHVCDLWWRAQICRIVCVYSTWLYCICIELMLWIRWTGNVLISNDSECAGIIRYVNTICIGTWWSQCSSVDVSKLWLLC